MLLVVISGIILRKITRYQARGIDEFEDRLALGIDHPLRLFRHEDLGYWGVTEVFRPDVVSTRIGFIFKGYPTLK